MMEWVKMIIDVDEHAHHANNDGFDEDRPC